MKLLRFFGKLFRKKHLKRRVGNIDILLRNTSNDLEVFDYVFHDKYHRPFPRLNDAPIILDLGSNIGMSIVDLMLEYPNARIIGFELDSENADLAKTNTKFFNEKVQIIEKGVWYEETEIKYHGKNSDSFAINNSDIINLDLKTAQTTTIEKIFQEFSLTYVDYVKMDIEGAELEIFKKSDLEWLNKVGQIKIEVHFGKEELNYFVRKLTEKGFNSYIDNHHWSTVIGVK